MQGSLVEHERRMLVLAYLEAQAEGDDADAARIRSYGGEDPELARMFDEADEEATGRSTQDSRLIGLVASLMDRVFRGPA